MTLDFCAFYRLFVQQLSEEKIVASSEIRGGSLSLHEVDSPDRTESL